MNDLYRILKILGLAVLTVGFLVVATFSVMWIFHVGIERQEIKECKQWKSYADNAPNHVQRRLRWSDWQLQQCRTHGIDIRTLHERLMEWTTPSEN